jgi:predicted nucleic acid-binding protein
MESAILGLVLDSSVLIAAERRKLTAAQAIENVQRTIGESPVVLSAVTVAEIGHGIHRANMPEIRERRHAFLDDLKATVPIYPVTEVTAEIIARIGGEQAHDRSLRARAWLRPWYHKRPRLQPHPRPEPDLPLNPDPVLIPRAAAGLGLNLTAAEYVFLLDPASRRSDKPADPQ